MEEKIGLSIAGESAVLLVKAVIDDHEQSYRTLEEFIDQFTDSYFDECVVNDIDPNIDFIRNAFEKSCSRIRS